MSSDELYEFYGDLKHETDDAYLVYDGEKEVWLPKSLTEQEGDIFIIPEWLAIREDIV